MKKSKRYRVTVNLKYIIVMDHTQTSMEKAKEDVKGLIDNYLNKDMHLDIRNLLNNETPHTSYKVEKKNNERR